MLNFGTTNTQKTLRNRAKEVAEQGAADFGRFNDSWINGFSFDFAATVSELGWIGLTWPKAYGGSERSPIERLIIGEEMLKAGAPVASFWFADRQMGPSILAFGTEEQKRRFLPDIAAGRTAWCIGMSEPEAGSDLAALNTKAELVADSWVISGQKIWTSFAHQANYCYLICRTSSGAKPHMGISEIVVPLDLPGIEIRPIKDMTGREHFCEIFFDNVTVPAENLIGVEGQAFKQTMRQLESERGGVDRLMSNWRLYQIARAEADQTNALVRDTIAKLEVNYRIGRNLVYRETLQQGPLGFSAATKVFCTEHQASVARFIGETLGPDALVSDSPNNGVASGLLYEPAYTIMGGTSNIMRNIVAERVLGLPR